MDIDAPAMGIPTEPVTLMAFRVATATTVSAPFALAEAGASLTTALPVASVSAEFGLNVPSAPVAEKFTT